MSLGIQTTAYLPPPVSILLPHLIWKVREKWYMINKHVNYNHNGV